MVKLFLAGGDGAGKSTLARQISWELNIPVLSFGDCVRQDLVDNYGFSMKDLKKKPTDRTIRTVLRLHGQTMKIQHGKDIWVKKFHENHSHLKSYVVDDVRFKVESDYARRVSGKVIFLNSDYDDKVSTFEELEGVARESDLWIENPKKQNPFEVIKEIIEWYHKGYGA